jgi:hypothetical protein
MRQFIRSVIFPQPRNMLLALGIEELPMSDELDERKVALDERRLDFEIRKYGDEQANRDVGLDKLKEEVKELKRP